MSPQPRPRRKPAASTKRKANGQVTTSIISGAALVLASVLPAALNPGPVGGGKSLTAGTPASSAPPTAPPTTVGFQPGCKLPFDSIKTAGLELDATCTQNGNAGDDVAKRLEIKAKNNFCADGAPTPIVFKDFTNLESASDKIPDLRKMLKTSRDRVSSMITSAGGATIGEGSLVQFVALLFHADFSNVGKGKGEEVNCKRTEKEDNDIHIQMMIGPNEDDPCRGVTAEMSPHFRPEAWNRLAKLEIKRPVRITGPLFF